MEEELMVDFLYAQERFLNTEDKNTVWEAEPLQKLSSEAS